MSFWVHVVIEVVSGGSEWEVGDRLCRDLESNFCGFDFSGEIIMSLIYMCVESFDEYMF